MRDDPAPVGVAQSHKILAPRGNFYFRHPIRLSGVNAIGSIFSANTIFGSLRHPLP